MQIDTTYGLKAAIAPFPIELSQPPVEALTMYRAWSMAYMDQTPTEDMWVPVGRVGPMVIIGHPTPETAAAPNFPLWAFGLNRISVETHKRLSLLTEERLSSTDAQEFELNAEDVFLPHQKHGIEGTRQLVQALSRFPGAKADHLAIEAILGSGISDPSQLIEALPAGWREAILAIQNDSAVLDLTSFTVNPKVAELLPDSFANEHQLIPIAFEGETLFAAGPNTAAGTQPKAIQSAWKTVRTGSAANARLTLILCPASARAAIAKRASKQAVVPTTVNRGVIQAAVAVVAKMTIKQKDLAKVRIDAQNISDSTLLQFACLRAIEAGASDLHIDSSAGMGNMRIRQHGTMRYLDSGRFKLDRLAALIQLLRVYIDANGGDLQPVDGKFTLRLDDKYYDVRVSILPAGDAAISGQGFAVLRFLPKDGGVKSINDLMLEKEEMKILLDTMAKPDGIVLVTGPTGSGKTTTLNAMLKHLAIGGLDPNNKEPQKIITIEDPVEYTIDGVQQISVTKHVPFARALKVFLRQDPDVILVGEIRDLETATTAIEAARTGHLVFSTLHTNGAVETIARLLGMGIPAHELDGSLLTLIAQRLVPRMCPNCKIQRTPDEHDRAIFARAEIPAPVFIFEPNHAGCPQCHNGIRGLLPIFEIVKFNRRLRRAVIQKASESEIQDICKQEGFRPLSYHTLVKAAAGIISIKEAARLTSGWD